jgi:hypothetical protein
LHVALVKIEKKDDQVGEARLPLPGMGKDDISGVISGMISWVQEKLGVKTALEAVTWTGKSVVVVDDVVFS